MPPPPTEREAVAKTIAEGASGWQVKRVQKLLRSRGYHPGPADGAFDQPVVTAVQHFQSDHGLDDDGIVGPKTWQALLSAPPAGDGGSHRCCKAATTASR
jgi:peptidoglycan hydrolase-like protein with peptidoglycan-binding domain